MDQLTEKDRITVKRAFKNTLQGAVSRFVRQKTEVTMEELLEFVSDNYSNFRSPTGSRYKGKDMKKILQGLLTDPFFIVSSNKVRIDVLDI